MEQTAQHSQGSDHSRWLPEGALAMERVAPDMQDMLRNMAQAAKGQPWSVAYAFGVRMRDAAASTTAGTDAADVVLHLHMTAFLELLGADSDRCDDPFQSSLYKTTLRRDFDQAAKDYVRAHGGEKAVMREMQARLDALSASAPARRKAKSPCPKDISIRLAEDADGPRIGELARASGFGVEGIDWTSVHPHWLAAELDGRVVGAIQIILSKPIGWLEMLSLDPDLTPREQAMAVKALVERGLLSLKVFGAQLAMGVVPSEMVGYQRILERRGAVDTGSGHTWAKRL